MLIEKKFLRNLHISYVSRMIIALTPAQEGHGLLEWFQRRSRGGPQGWRPSLTKLIQPEEKDLGRLYRRFSVLTEGLQEAGEGGEFFIRECTSKTRSDAFKLK